MKHTLKFALVFLFSFALSIPSAMAQQCVDLFRQDGIEIMKLSPVEQWLATEQRGNDWGHQQPDVAELPVRDIPMDEVQVLTTANVPQNIIDSLIRGNSVKWLTDPTNTLTGMPFEDRPVAEVWKSNYTMSRSKIVFTSKNTLGYSVKLATNNPQKGENNSKKADLRKSVIISIDRGRHVEATENRIGKDPRLVILKDVMSIIDKASGNGYVVRDISYLLNGNRFLPNMSIPFVGREIARINGEAYDTFFEKYYVKDLAVAKALLLLRYGLQMKFPHGQNTLKEFSKTFKPEVATVVRDMSDASLYGPIAKIIAPEAYQVDIEKQTTLASSIAVNWDNSAYQFKLYENNAEMNETLTKWRVIHEQTFLQTIEKELRVKFPRYNGVADIGYIDRFFCSTAGEKALIAYHERLRRIHQNLPSQATTRTSVRPHLYPTSNDRNHHGQYATPD